MKNFMKFYKWAMNTKLHMSIYFVAILAVKCLCNLLFGNYTVDILTMFEMLLIMFFIAAVESVLLPNDFQSYCTRKQLISRTLYWVVFMNCSTIGFSIFFHWFPSLPVWAYVILLFFLELGLFFMWYGVHFIQKIDTDLLNEGLKNIQNSTN